MEDHKQEVAHNKESIQRILARKGLTLHRLRHSTPPKDEGIIRNKGKIAAIIKNAATFKTIKRECGSFQTYLSSMDKSNNYSAVIKDLTTRFKWLGPPSASLFLYTVGEPIKHIWEM